MATSWNKLRAPSTAPAQLVTNGSFATATDWSSFDGTSGTSGFTALPSSGWSYGVSSAVYTPTPPFGHNLVQDIGIQLSAQYQVTITFVINAGSISVGLGDTTIGNYSSSQTVSGTFTSGNGTNNHDITSFLHFGPTSNFDGAISNISVVGPGNFDWTEIPKPSATMINSYGTPLGLLLAILRPVSVTTDVWTRITDPTTAWTKINKPT